MMPRINIFCTRILYFADIFMPKSFRSVALPSTHPYKMFMTVTVYSCLYFVLLVPHKTRKQWQRKPTHRDKWKTHEFTALALKSSVLSSFKRARFIWRGRFGRNWNAHFLLRRQRRFAKNSPTKTYTDANNNNACLNNSTGHVFLF